MGEQWLEYGEHGRSIGTMRAKHEMFLGDMGYAVPFQAMIYLINSLSQHWQQWRETALSPVCLVLGF